MRPASSASPNVACHVASAVDGAPRGRGVEGAVCERHMTRIDLAQTRFNVLATSQSSLFSLLCRRPSVSPGPGSYDLVRVGDEAEHALWIFMVCLERLQSSKFQLILSLKSLKAAPFGCPVDFVEVLKTLWKDEGHKTDNPIL